MDERGKGVQINGDSETESNEKGWEKENHINPRKPGAE